MLTSTPVATGVLGIDSGSDGHQVTEGADTGSSGRMLPVARVPIRLSLARLAAVILPLAAVEGVVYPLLLHDSTVSWLSYSVYLALGVVLPGTLVAQAFVRWRADWLTWIGIGWALGHVLEVLAIQLAKCVGLPRFFVVWIPIAYVLIWRKRRWQGEVTTVAHLRRCAVLLAVLVAFASATFVALNLPELSPQPAYETDVFFHMNEAHEFRDHVDTSDPRIAGEPYAYHTLEYGPAVGANLAVQVPLANLVSRYSGLSMIWLLVLLLFNSARNLGGPVAGFLGAALIVAPLDVFSLISSKLSFGSSIFLSGLDLSTSTLVGFWALRPSSFRYAGSSRKGGSAIYGSWPCSRTWPPDRKVCPALSSSPAREWSLPARSSNVAPPRRVRWRSPSSSLWSSP